MIAVVVIVTVLRHHAPEPGAPEVIEPVLDRIQALIIIHGAGHPCGSVSKVYWVDFVEAFTARCADGYTYHLYPHLDRPWIVKPW